MDFAALQHSVFLQALGSAILNSLWQCFIVWLIYETISASYKTASARFKNNLATVLLFFSFAWFLTSFVSKILNQREVTSAVTAQNGFAVESQAVVHSVSGLGEFLSYASASLPYLSVAYIFLLAFLISRLFAAYRYVYVISNKRLMRPTGELQFFASKVAIEIGITRKISVWISHHIDVPATIGFLKPVILIPLASINNLSGQQLEAIILHELAHIRRNDYITNLIISVIETILFFNPFIVLLSNAIKRERENCCDDFVLQYRYDPHSYASALLRLEQSRMNKLQLAIGAVSGKKQLLSRIKRITNSQVVSRQFNYGQKIIALLLVTAVICSVAWLSPEEKKSMVEKPVAKSKIAPLKVTAASKAQARAEVIIAGKPIENLPPVNVRHVSPRSEPTPPELTDNDIENVPFINSPDQNDDDKEAQDLSAGEDNTDFSELTKLKQPLFAFDEKNLKLPSFIGIQNFLLQNINLNIDLSKIDMGEFNKNLKQAYKEINAVDWNKVQNDIQLNLGKIRQRGKLSQKVQDALLFAERAKILSRENALHSRQLYMTRASLDQIKNEMLVHDSLHVLEMKLLNKNIKMQRVYNNRPQREYEGNGSGNTTYYYNYSNTANSADNEGEDVKPCDQMTGSSKPGKKTVQISIRRGPNNTPHTGVLNEKKGFQLSFSGNDDERPNHQSVISVEIDN